MPNPYVADLRLTISFSDPLPLVRFFSSIPELQDQGVYALREGTCPVHEFDPLAPEVKYIGKAIRETVFSRCQKHLWTVTDTPNRNGAPKTRPGHRFKVYRATRQLNPDGLYVYPALMADAEPYLVSCAEELLLYRYSQVHGDIPAANTKR